MKEYDYDGELYCEGKYLNGEIVDPIKYTRKY